MKRPRFAALLSSLDRLNNRNIGKQNSSSTEEICGGGTKNKSSLVLTEKSNCSKMASNVGNKKKFKTKTDQTLIGKISNKRQTQR